jgi:hypothetical protein
MIKSMMIALELVVAHLDRPDQLYAASLAHTLRLVSEVR